VRERGQALVLFAAGLGFFLALVGISVDVGQLVYARTDLQKIADAGAFAGSQDLPDPNKATVNANKYITKNGASTCSENCVVISTTKQTNDTITVVTQRQVSYTFLRILGMTGHTVSARAKITSQIATGYQFDNDDVFPYAVWGGNPAKAGCPYGVCPGGIEIYRDNNYAQENVEPNPKNNKNWNVTSNKFKGFFHAGSDVYQINSSEWQTFSYGGNSAGSEPLEALHEHYLSGEPVILPVIGAARDCGGVGQTPCVFPDDGSTTQGVQFKIVAWVAIRLTVDPLNVSTSVPFAGEVVANYSSPHGDTTGGELPPTELAPRVVHLVE
jgi:Flp pilus assembly protein TadG